LHRSIVAMSNVGNRYLWRWLIR